jgi:hypothetical protein
MKPQTSETDSVAAAEEALRHLEECLRHRLGSQVCDLRLALRGGGVVLQGHARTFYAKQLAQHALMRIARLVIAANEIQVS